MSHSAGCSTSRTDYYILLMNDDEAQFFSRLLPKHANISHADDLTRLRKSAEDAPTRTRLISFCSGVIVPPDILTRLHDQCFNFHPGPPERPGYRPAAFASAENAPAFGVTFHLMAPQVDSGSIYRVRRFPLTRDMDEHAVTLRAYEELIALAIELAPELSDWDHRFPATSWKWTGLRTTRSQHRKLPRLSL